jgi:hypothetical protein
LNYLKLANLLSFYKPYPQTCPLGKSIRARIVTVLSDTIMYEQLPFRIWINAGDSITFSYAKTIETMEKGKQYILESSNSTSSLMINGPTSIQGYYQSQIDSPDFTLNNIALVAILLIVPASLIIPMAVRRKKRKKKI